MRAQLGFACVASSCAADQPERCKARFRKLIHSCCRLTAAMEVEAIQGEVVKYPPTSENQVSSRVPTVALKV